MAEWKEFLEKKAQVFPAVHPKKMYQQGANNIADGAVKATKGVARAAMSGLGAIAGYMEGARQANDRPVLDITKPRDVWNYFKDSWSQALGGAKAGAKAGWNAAPAVYSGVAEGAKEAVPGLLDNIGLGDKARQVQSSVGFSRLMDGIASWQDKDDAARLANLPEEDIGNDSSQNWRDYLDSVEMNNDARKNSMLAGELGMFSAGAMPFSLAAKAVAPLKLVQPLKNGVSMVQKAAPYADMTTMVAPSMRYAHGEWNNYLSGVERIRDLYAKGTDDQRRIIKKNYPMLVVGM